MGINVIDVDCMVIWVVEFQREGYKIRYIQLKKYRSIFSQIHIFNNQAVIWHHIVSGFLKICTDLQETCSIWAQNCFYCCFWTIYSSCDLKLLRNNKKNNFALICCKFLANLCKSSEILEQCHVNWWLKYRNSKSVSWRLSCTYYNHNHRYLELNLA